MDSGIQREDSIFFFVLLTFNHLAQFSDGVKKVLEKEHAIAWSCNIAQGAAEQDGSSGSLGRLEHTKSVLRLDISA